MQFIDLKSQQKRIRSKIERRILKVLDEGMYIMGPEINELEEKLASYVGVKYCITCASGTDALLIPLMAKKIGPGDAVITTPFTYIATAEVISLVGAEPVFADVYPNTFNIDPAEIEKAIYKAKEKGLTPRAIIPVNLFGLPARYRVIREIAKKENLFVIEDAAQGFGGSIRRNKGCSFGDAASTSFFPAKPLGCYGDGGAVFTNDREIYEIANSSHIHGMGKKRYEYDRIGMNARMSTIQAAILLEKLEIFPEELQKRQIVADNYNKIIGSLNLGIKLPKIYKNLKSSWAQYTIILPENINRDKLQEYLKSKNIPTAVYYPIPLNEHKPYSNYPVSKSGLDVTYYLSKNVLSLPMHPYLKEDEIIYISENIKNFIKKD